MTQHSAADLFFRPALPARRPAQPITATIFNGTIDLTDLSSDAEWSFEHVSDSDEKEITISSSESSVEPLPLTKDVKRKVKQFRKTRPKPDGRLDDEDLPASRYARKVSLKARGFLDNEASHSGADSGDSAYDDTGYISNLINDSPSSSESDAASADHEILTSEQRIEYARNAAEDAINVIIPALANPPQRSSNVTLTWYDPKTDKVCTMMTHDPDNIKHESDGELRWAYVPDVPQLSPRQLKRKRRRDAITQLKDARVAKQLRKLPAPFLRRNFPPGVFNRTPWGKM